MKINFVKKDNKNGIQIVLYNNFFPKSSNPERDF